jgi:hypothetical protein
MTSDATGLASWQAPAAPALRIYDSGWFEASTYSIYLKTHNLGTAKVITKLYWAFDSLGTGMQTVETRMFGASDHGSVIADITTTNLKVLTGDTLTGYIDGAGGYGNRTSGYLRVTVLALE